MTVGTVLALVATTGGCGEIDEASPEDIAVKQSAIVGGQFGYSYARSSVFAQANGNLADPSVTGSSIAGVQNTIFPLTSPGAYDVTFPGLGADDFGALQLTAYGIGSNRCAIGFGPVFTTGQMVTRVFCSNATGAPASSRFTLSAYDPPPGIANFWGYASVGILVFNGTSTPSPRRNSTGGTNTVQRLSVGRYIVTFPGFSGIGNAQITSTGGGSNVVNSICKLVASTNQYVSVACFDYLGRADDTAFTVSYGIHQSPHGMPTFHYLMADQPTVSSYVAGSQEGRRVSGAAFGSATVQRTGRGSYVVMIPNISTVASTATVTSVGTTPDYCKLAGIDRTSPNTYVSVYCYDLGGKTVDTKFSLAYGSQN
jgi:hypothetical protein